jgi:hypothetical protein
VVALIAALGLLTLAVAAPSARAGMWMQVSCVNPNGSAAPSEGWTGGPVGTPDGGAYAAANCSAASPMASGLESIDPAPVGDTQELTYTPPAGSTLAGGVMQVHAFSGGYHLTNSEPSAEASVTFNEPTMAFGDNFFACVAYFVNCHTGSGSPVDYTGPVTLPANRGGSLYAVISCGGTAGQSCDTNADYGSWALAQIDSADLLLSNSGSPTGTGFSGSALQSPIRGMAHLVFIAGELAGPGVYEMTAAIDGHQVWSGAPNANGGRCVPVGTDAATGALMFDWAQPCPTSETVDALIPTAGLPDGSHRLSVTVTDAAMNTATVFDQNIVTSNPQQTPLPRGGIRARFVISWSWRGRVTTLRSIAARHVPPRAHIVVRCLGPRCPRLASGTVTESRLHKRLSGRRFFVGDRLVISVEAPRRRPERIEVTIRNNRIPRAVLVRRS